MEIHASDLVTFVTFLKTGKLGNLDFGMSLDSVLDYLGLPTGYNSLEEFKRTSDSQLWKLEGTPVGHSYGILYTCIGLAFRHQQLTSVTIFPRLYASAPNQEMPTPFQGYETWITYINEQLSDKETWQQFLDEFDISNIKLHSYPFGWESRNPDISITLDRGKTPYYIKQIRSRIPR